MFNNTDSLKEAFIMLIAQLIQKERTLNNVQRNGNMFHLLKTMKTHKLTLVIRNSTEIDELVAATRKLLSKEKIIEKKKKFCVLFCALQVILIMSQLYTVISILQWCKLNVVPKFQNAKS